MSEARKARESIARLRQKGPLSVVIVLVASLLLEMAYFVSAGLVVATIIVWSGASQSALLGGGIFAAVMVLEFGLVFVFNKPGPLFVLFSIPAVVGLVSIKQAYSAEMVREIIRQIETAVRTPPLFRGM